MAKRIADFLSKNSVPDKVATFAKLSQGKSKEEIRNLEMELLAPEPIPTYIGEARRYVMNSEFALKIVFKDQEEMDLFGSIIPIASYMENSATDIKIILDLFKAINSGTVSYNKKSGEFTLNKKEKSLQGDSEAKKGVENGRAQGEGKAVRRFFRR